MRQWQVWAGAVLMMGLVGCESVQRMAQNIPGAEHIPGLSSQGPVEATVPRQVPFPAETYAALPKTGTATIKGRLAYRLTSGQTVYGNREKVSIAPATEYSAEAADRAPDCGAPDIQHVSWGFAFGDAMGHLDESALGIAIDQQICPRIDEERTPDFA